MLNKTKMTPYYTQPQLPLRQTITRFIFFAFIAVIIIAAVLNFHDLTAQIKQLPTLRWPIVLLALLFLLTSHFMAALVYIRLSRRQLALTSTMLVQMAAAAANKVVPAGLGAIGANAAYLKRCGHSLIEAGSIVTINNLLGASGHLILLFIAYCFDPVFPDKFLPDFTLTSASYIVVAIATLIISMTFLLFRKRLVRVTVQIKRELKRYKRRKASIFMALVLSMLMTICTIAVFACCLSALNVHLSPIAIMIVFSLGITISTIVPTPGGLGGFEAGLIAGLITYGIATNEAIVAAILYRLLTYWLPLAYGSAALAFCHRRRLLY